ncbi:MAG: hypothetical protein H0T76_19080 [Nannocystis sp.]|nr:hypothetical protein [Nannocystis sp.]MBA3548593.1 hypothetical protein [Nannocystis sp.]
MMSTNLLLRLVLNMAPPEGSSLPPEADAHNKRAMVFYDQDRLVDALVAFRAAYDAMPDVRRDRVGRKQLIDSMHFTLVRLHEIDGGPEALCQLERLMQEHIAALNAAFPELPEVGTVEYSGTLQRLRSRLAAFPPDVCVRETATVTVPSERTDEPVPTATEAPAAATGPSELAVRPDVPPPVQRIDRRRVRIGVGTLVPGLLLFAPMAGLLAYRADGERELAALREHTKDRTLTPQQDADAAALGKRYTSVTAGAVVLGVTGAALVVTGAALLAAGARQRRMAVAPWGARGIGGLLLQGRF